MNWTMRFQTAKLKAWPVCVRTVTVQELALFRLTVHAELLLGTSSYIHAVEAYHPVRRQH